MQKKKTKQNFTMRWKRKWVCMLCEMKSCENLLDRWEREERARENGKTESEMWRGKIHFQELRAKCTNHFIRFGKVRKRRRRKWIGRKIIFEFEISIWIFWCDIQMTWSCRFWAICILRFIKIFIGFFLKILIWNFHDNPLYLSTLII